ncbi:MAG: response regulator [Candidatus Sericytochromatia bacterium]
MAKILAIDDEERMLELIQAFLEHDEHDVRTATNGSAALETARQFVPDLILCDVQMPDMDGYAVLKTMREDEALMRIPFVFLTGLDDMRNLRQGMNLGADDYLTKPFSYADLTEAIRVRLEKHRAIAEQYAAELREAEEKVDQALHSDAVTGLPNRQRLRELFLNRSLEKPQMAVLSLGFDRLNELVEGRPEAFVNVLLKSASTRLRSVFAQDDELFHIERNQFVVLMPSEMDSPAVHLKAQALIGKLNDPVKLMQQELLPSASVGIALFPRDGDDLNTLLRQAESARHKAEAAGGNQHRFHD